jgi:hypothetical protein
MHFRAAALAVALVAVVEIMTMVVILIQFNPIAIVQT